MTGEIFSVESFLWSCLWQSTIFIVAGLFGSFLFRRHSARAHRVLFLAMIAAVIVPAASILVKHYELGLFVAEPVLNQPPIENRTIHEATDIISNEAIKPAHAPINKDFHPPIAVSEAAKFPWFSALLYIWISASLILAARLLVTFVLGIRLLSNAEFLSCDIIEQALHHAKTKLGIKKDVKIYSNNHVHSPVIWCWSRIPILLVPSATISSDIDWAGVLCHELAHYKRRDHVTGLLAELTVCLLPWNPLLWLAKSRLISLSEQACDDWVVTTGQTSTDYAESLLNLIPEVQMAFVPAVVHSKRGLSGRVSRILKDSCGNPQTGAVWALTARVIVICLAVGIAFAQTKPARLTSTVKTKLGKSAVIEEPAFPVTAIKGRILDPNDETPYWASIVALPVTSYADVVRHNNKDGYFELPWSPTWIEDEQPICLIAIDRQKKHGAIVEIPDPTSTVTIRLKSTCTLTGKVVDPNGEPMTSRVTSSLARPFKCRAPILTSGTVRDHIDNSNRGKFTLSLPYNQKYKLNIQAEGYQSTELTVNINDMSKENIDIGTITLQPENPTIPTITEQDQDPDLAKEFHQIYRLEEGEVIKFIKAPFVLGRQEFLHTVGYGPGSGLMPLGLQHGDSWQTGFRWDGELKTYSGYGSASPRLWWILRMVLGIETFDFEIPKGLNIHVPYGDWIVLADAPRNEQFRSLEEIIYAETKRAIRFELRKVEREVIVVKGRYQFKSHPNGAYPNHVHLTWDGKLEQSEGRKNSLAELFRRLEQELKLKIVDETEPIEHPEIRYKGGDLYPINQDPAQRNERLRAFLDNLTKTTSLQFTVELQPAEIWFVTEATEN